MSSKPVFDSFADYWSIGKFLNNKQRRVILSSLPKAQRSKLEEDCKTEGWECLFVRNRFDGLLDSIQEEFGIDLLRLRMLVLGGKGVYVKRKFWEHVNKPFSGYAEKHTGYIFGGIRAIESEFSSEEYRLVRAGEK